MAGQMRIEKILDRLPDVLSKNTVYFIKDGDACRMYVSDATGTTALPVGGNTVPIDEIEPFLLLGVGCGEGI